MIMEENKVAQNAIDNEPEVVFNVLSDRRVFGVRSEDDEEMIFEISGYDMQIKFNRSKLQTLEEVEGTLDGIKEMFRQLIMADLLDNNENNAPSGNA